jgi:hypothetical protein
MASIGIESELNPKFKDYESELVKKIAKNKKIHANTNLFQVHNYGD